MNSVNMTMKSTQGWDTPEVAQQFVDILVNKQDFLLPQKYDMREPLRFAFGRSKLDGLFRIWESESAWLLLKREKPYPTHMTIKKWKYREHRQFNELLAGFDERYFADESKVTKLLSFAKQIYLWGRMAHGYACHQADWDSKNYLGQPTIIAGRLLSVGGIALQDCLPGIYWANFFGPIYVRYFGREKFETVPAYYKEELDDGGYLLLTSANPLEYGKPQVRTLEESIVDHLGRGAFFEKTLPQKDYVAPTFAFEQQVLGAPIEVTSYDPTNLVIPEPERFLKEVANLAQRLETVFGRTLDYSPESLEQVDRYILEGLGQEQEPWRSSKGREMLQRLAAYYGEVLRKNLGGKWAIMVVNGTSHPAISLSTKHGLDYELPITRVIKLMSEGEYADGLAAQYHLIQSGELALLKKHLRLLGRQRS